MRFGGNTSQTIQFLLAGAEDELVATACAAELLINGFCVGHVRGQSVRERPTPPDPLSLSQGDGEKFFLKGLAPLGPPALAPRTLRTFKWLRRADQEDLK